MPHIHRIIAVFSLLVLVGCGPPEMVNVSGRLLKDGHPMVVPKEAYVTLSFIPAPGPDGKAVDQMKSSSHPAKFDNATGGYSVRMPPGYYKTMLVFAPPPDAKQPDKWTAPKTTSSALVHEVKGDKTLDIEVPK